MKKIFIRPFYFAILVALFSLIFIIEAFYSQHLDYVFDFVGVGGTFKNHDLTILGIPAYWFFMLFGLVICIFVSWSKKDAYSLNKIEAIIYPIIFLIFSFLGGKLLYVVENYKSVFSNGISLDGLSLFGAIYLSPLVFYIISKITKKNFNALLDFCTVFGLILLACTRMGCFISGCCEASKIWFNENPIILPVQLFEVVLDLLILELCMWIENKKFMSGMMYPILMASYGLVRFILEFLRKSEDVFLFLSRGHINALICFVAGTIVLICMHVRFKVKMKSSTKHI